MSFAAPLFLAGLVLVPLAVVAPPPPPPRASARTAAFASPALLPSVAPRRPGWRRHVAPALYAVALSGLLVALARPQATVAVDVEQASIVLVTDISGSMQARDVAPSRLVAAQRAGRQLLDQVPRGVRVGLVAFNQTPRVLAAPTTDRERLRGAIDALRPSGGTATGDALTAGLAATGRKAGAPPPGTPPAAIVLLSDGKSTRGRSLLDVARDARQRRVPVYTVALGTPTGTIQAKVGGRTELRRVPPDAEAMQRVAAITGAQSFTAQTTGQLSSVYERLGSKVTSRRQRREVTSAFAAGSLLLLLLGGGLSLRWFRQVA